MEEAIDKILKNFVFKDNELPEVIIKSGISPDNGKTFYRVHVMIPKKHKVYLSLLGNIEIMERLKIALVALGLSGVTANRFIDNYGDMLMTTEGYI